MAEHLHWKNLTRRERREYMQLQMSPSSRSGYGAGGYLPEDCSECGACGEPTLGCGWCTACYARFEELLNKLKGKP